MAKADIEVNNRRYSVACAPGQETRLVMLGARLDKRVRQIDEAVGDIGEARLFLIAALALLDELEAGGASSAPAAQDGETAAIEEKAATALNQAADRIEALAVRLDTPSR